MELPPDSTAPLYLESYVYVVDAAEHEQLRSIGAAALNCSQVDLASLLPSANQPEACRQAVTTPLTGALFSVAEELGVARRTDLSGQSRAQLRRASQAAWLQMRANATDLPSASRLHNPLMHPDTLDQLWEHALDRRRAMPELDSLIIRAV